MSHAALRALCVLLVLVPLAGAQMPEGMHRYVFGLIVTGETSREGLAPDELAQLQRGHLANIERLAQEGKLVVAGPFESRDERRGIFVFDVASVEEAEELCATDPLVGPGYLDVELVPWWATDDLLDMAARWRADNAPADETVTEVTPDPTPPPSLDDLATTYVDHYMAGEIDALEPHLAEDVHFADPTADVTGKQAVLAEWRRVFAALDIEEFTTERTLISPRHALVSGTVRFRRSGAFAGMPADESLVFEVAMAVGLTFDGSRVVDHVDHLDSAAFRSQLMEQIGR